jgi:hypothetical protein
MAVVMQPVGNVYVIAAVPGEMPVTIPAEEIVATAVAAQLQPPPVDEVPRAVVRPEHRVILPVIAAGSGFTETVLVMLLVQP